MKTAADFPVHSEVRVIAVPENCQVALKVGDTGTVVRHVSEQLLDVASAGGRVYLAPDHVARARTHAELLRELLDELGETFYLRCGGSDSALYEVGMRAVIPKDGT